MVKFPEDSYLYLGVLLRTCLNWNEVYRKHLRPQESF